MTRKNNVKSAKQQPRMNPFAVLGDRNDPDKELVTGRRPDSTSLAKDALSKGARSNKQKASANANLGRLSQGPLSTVLQK